MLARESAQLWDELRKIVLLEQADAGDACRTGVKTRAGIGERDASEGEDGGAFLAGLVEGIQARGGGVFFFEDWTEDDEVYCSCCGTFRDRVTGLCHTHAGEGPPATFPDGAYGFGGDVI